MLRKKSYQIFIPEEPEPTPVKVEEIKKIRKPELEEAISAEEEAILPQILPPPPPPPEKVIRKYEKLMPLPVPSEEILDDDYDVFEVDLSVPHTDYAVGLKEAGILANTMTIDEAPSEFFFKINKPSKRPLRAVVGKKFELMPIQEIYVTNPPGMGIAKIVVTFKRKYALRE